MRRRQLDTAVAVRRYVVGISVVGVLLVAATLATLPAGTPSLALLALAIATVPTGDTPVRFRSGAQNEHRFTMEELVLPALLLVGPLPYVPLIVAAGVAIVHALRRAPFLKAVYNVASSLVGASSAVFVAWVIAGGAAPGADASGLSAVVVGSVANEAITLFLLGGLFRILERRPIRSTVTDNLTMITVTTIVNVLLGLLLGVSVVAQPITAWFALAAVLVVRAGLRQYGEVLVAEAQSFQLHALTSTFADIASMESARLEDVLAAVAQTFHCEMVQLQFRRGDGPVQVATHGRPGSPVSTRLGHVLTTGETLLLREHAAGPHDDRHRDGVIVPLHADDLRGAIGVFDRAGTAADWTQRDVALLKVLAQQLATAMRNRQLFRTVQAERSALATETSKLKDVLDAAADGIAMLDVDGRVVTWNVGLEDITGLAATDVVGRRLTSVLPLRDGDGLPYTLGPPELAAAFDGVRGTTDVEFRRGEEWRWLRCSFSPVRRDDAVVGVVVVARDVSRERELALLKTDFLAAVSHELRTPLTPLRGFLQLLTSREGSVPADQLPRIYDSMVRQVGRLEALVGDLLVMADLDRGSADVDARPVALSALAEAAIDAERHRDDDERITVEIDDDPYVATDRQACVRIARALIDNALKHTKGPVVVRTERAGPTAYLKVVDAGPGIPSWEQQAIFEAFRRVGSHLEWSTQGPGLGLSIARGLAERIGGQLELASSEEDGSTFTLRMPAVVGD